MPHTNNLISWLTADTKESIPLSGVLHKNARRMVYLLQPNNKPPIRIEKGLDGSGVYDNITLTELNEVKFSYDFYATYEKLPASERCPYNGHSYPEEVLKIDGMKCKNCRHFVRIESTSSWKPLKVYTSCDRHNGRWSENSLCSDFVSAFSRGELFQLQLQKLSECVGGSFSAEYFWNEFDEWFRNHY